MSYKEETLTHVGWVLKLKVIHAIMLFLAY